MNLDATDKTPNFFCIKEELVTEKIKKTFRRFIYPVLTKFRQRNLERNYKLKSILGVDTILADQRGNDYEAHRRRVNEYKNIKDSVVLIIGIGTGRDLESWLKYHPKKIIAVDYFNYKKAWEMRVDYYHNKYNTKIEFIQADILDMNMIESNSIDIIGSDAVFEHINKFDDALIELHRVLEKDGVLYATYGPLWCSWGGDHISGRNNIADGYNHIRLSKSDYEEYLASFGSFNHQEDDGRTWINNNLFSYLKPFEYLKKLEDSGFYKVYNSVILEKRAIEFKSKYSAEFKEMEDEFGSENLIITGMTIVYGKYKA